jgi:cell wall-associated NlpC family hydrolase
MRKRRMGPPLVTQLALGVVLACLLLGLSSSTTPEAKVDALPAKHIDTEDLASEARGGIGKAIVHAGKAKIGEPYDFGYGGWTCSEFTSYAIAQATGVVLPADYMAQREYGWVPMTPHQGDLLVYSDHVGIKMKGGMVLHASNYFGIVTISDASLAGEYLYAKRIR